MFPLCSGEKAVQRGCGRVSGGPKEVWRAPQTEAEERLEQRRTGDAAQYTALIFSGSRRGDGCVLLFCVNIFFGRRWPSLTASRQSCPRLSAKLPRWKRGTRRKMTTKDGELMSQHERCRSEWFFFFFFIRPIQVIIFHPRLQLDSLTQLSQKNL